MVREPRRRPRRGSAGETAEQRRARMRKDAALERERLALELFVSGKSYPDIAAELGVVYSTAWNLVHRGLVRRAEQDGEIAQKARALLQMQIEALMGVWMPRALGQAYTRDGERIPPDPRALDGMDKLIRRYGEITGALAPVKIEGELKTGPATPDEAVAAIMAALQRVSQKETTIEGHLADVGHTQHELTTGERSDALPPPFQERAA